MTQRPDVGRVWANNAPSANIQDPDKFSSGKVEKGWEAEIPPFQWFNWVQNRNDLFKLALLERGIPAWGNEVSYARGAVTFNDTDGWIYIASSANTNRKPDENPSIWKRSAIQLSEESFDEVVSLLDKHTKNVDNPHNVTAEQIKAYTKAQVDSLIAQLADEIEAHTVRTDNPHQVTAEEVGAVPKTGGTYTGQVNTKANKFIVGKGKTSQECGMSSAGGAFLYQGSNKLGLSDSNKPVYMEGNTVYNLLHGGEFDEARILSEFDFAIPRPDYFLPLTSDINVYEGEEVTEFARNTVSQVVNKQGNTVTVGVDVPRFTRNGLMIHTGESFKIPSTVIPTGNFTYSIRFMGGNGWLFSADSGKFGVYKSGTNFQLHYNGQREDFTSNLRSNTSNVLTVTRTGNDVKVYINGVYKGVINITQAVYGVNIYLGASQTGTGQANTEYSDFRIWNFALSNKQIATLG